MTVIHKAAVIVGGGPGGLAAGVRLKQLGITDILILEREKQLGGILRQCIHDGFGVTRFGETLSGPEYAKRFTDIVEKEGIEYKTDTTVLSITRDKRITAVSPEGMIEIDADAVILTTGCRERTRGSSSIPGERPAGVYTAGVAQTYINLKNIMVGKKVVIRGSGDIGLIMARRLTLEGAKVVGVFSAQPYPNGLPRNVEQCLNDFDIPLYLSHTITYIYGGARLEAIEASEVDENRNVIPGTSRRIECDTLIMSVGLIPENELSIGASVELDPRTGGAFVDENFMTNVDGIFAAGNCLHVHDLVDFVSLEAEKLADAAAEYIRSGKLPKCGIKIATDRNIGHIIPQTISGTKDVTLYFRVKRPIKGCTVKIQQDNKDLISKRYMKLIPAEMTEIKLEKKKVESTGDIKVVIEHE